MALRMLIAAIMMAVLATSSADDQTIPPEPNLPAETTEPLLDNDDAIIAEDSFLPDEGLLYCAPLSPCPFFELSMICDRVYTTRLSSGLDETTTCVVSKIVCDATKTSGTVTDYYVVNGVPQEKRTGEINDLGGGKLTRQYDGEDTVYEEYPASISLYADNSFKMSCISCSSPHATPVLAMVSDYHPVDFTDERLKLELQYPGHTYLQLADNCNPLIFFPPNVETTES